MKTFGLMSLETGMRPGYGYFPHWMEFAISAGLVADALLVIWLAYRFLPIARHEEKHRSKRHKADLVAMHQ